MRIWRSNEGGKAISRALYRSNPAKTNQPQKSYHKEHEDATKPGIIIDAFLMEDDRIRIIIDGSVHRDNLAGILAQAKNAAEALIIWRNLTAEETNGEEAKR